MNPAKCDEYSYIDFLIATPHTYTCTEAARVQPDPVNPPAHDALTRLLHRLEPSSGQRWEEVKPHVQLKKGLLVMDDSTLDKPYARKMGLVSRHGSGKHHAVAKGINLLSLLWTEGDSHLPCDYRLYEKAHDALTKNDHFLALLQSARDRGFEPECVAFDSWYASLTNLKTICGYGWIWLTRLKANRLVSQDYQGKVPVCRLALDEAGSIVHLKGYGLIKVFRVVTPDGDTQHWATNALQMTGLQRLSLAEHAWTIEQYHRGIKQFCGIERCQARATKAQRNHIGLALRGFLCLERYSFRTGHSWFELKTRIVREAVRAYLAQPLHTLPPTA